MNQKSLLIAIVAVAAVLIVAALWLTGAWQTGPLSGFITPTTTLTFTATEYIGCEDGIMARWISFSGTLKDASNNPIPNRDVTIYNAAGPYSVTSLKTDQNGAFSTVYGINGCCAESFYARFAGDSSYPPSQSTTSSVPASNYCNK
jgi:hypothetical protein